MKNLIETIGNIVAIVGIALIVVAIGIRATGGYYLAGFQLMTLLNAGMGLILIGIFGKLHVLGQKIK
jgi:hypothetical protein